MAAFLRAHPSFLADNPALYEDLCPPRRVHGTTLADHMAVMLDGARHRAALAERASLQATEARRAAEGFARRVQDAVLGLMRATDAAWLATHDLASLLRVDGARLCCEDHPPAGAARVPRGTVVAALGQRAALVRQARPDAMLHGEAVALAAEEALVRIRIRTGPALLALAARDASGLAGANTETLGFLGHAVAAALERAADRE